MKKKLNLSLLFLILFVVSCSNNNDVVLSEKINDISLQDGMIKFKNISVFESTIEKLYQLNKQESKSLIGISDLRTINDVLNEANEEVTILVNSCNDKSEFLNKYSDLKQKYKSSLMFNSINENYISPYSRAKNPIYNCFINSDFKYMIGDKIYTADKYIDFNEYNNNILNRSIAKTILLTNSGMQKSQSTYSSVNSAWSEQSDRQVYMTIYGVYGSNDIPWSDFKSIKIFADVVAWKKSFLGFWYKYTTNIYMKYSVNTGMMYGTELSPVSNPYPANTSLTMSINDSEATVQLGFCAGVPRSSTILGNASVFSTGVPESKAGKTSIIIN